MKFVSFFGAVVKYVSMTLSTLNKNWNVWRPFQLLNIGVEIRPREGQEERETERVGLLNNETNTGGFPAMR